MYAVLNNMKGSFLKQKMQYLTVSVHFLRFMERLSMIEREWKKESVEMAAKKKKKFFGQFRNFFVHKIQPSYGA